MASIFTDVLKKAVQSNALLANARSSRNWLISSASRSSTSPNSIIKSNTIQKTDDPFIGSMLLFQYDPKMKKTLPYYDRFPLIFPFSVTGDGFYGINLHYLPLRERAMVMDSLYQIATVSTTGEMRVNLSYELLNSMSRSHLMKHCVKHYLNKHVRSKFAVVPSKEWEIALFLPLERFAKAGKNDVYADIHKRR
jgi:hypothetical protein